MSEPKPKTTFEKIAEEDSVFLYGRSSIKLLITSESNYNSSRTWGQAVPDSWRNIAVRKGLFANYVISACNGRLFLIKNRRTYKQFLEDCNSVGLEFEFANGKVNHRRTSSSRARDRGGPESIELIPTEETRMMMVLAGIYDIHEKNG